MALALFGAGAVAKSFVARIPWLATRLGPVGAPSFRLASRIVNSMKAGHAVKSLEAFQPCKVVLICVPDKALVSVVTRLSQAPVSWAGKSVVLCDSVEDSTALSALSDLGAAVAVLSPVEGPAARFIVEGDRQAVREAKQLVREMNGQAIELNSETMSLYMAGVSFGSSLFIPLAATCVKCVANASGSTLDGTKIAEALYQRWLRAYFHSGKKSWSGPLARGDQKAVFRELEALHRSDRSAERLYRELAVFALEWSKRHPELLKRLREDGTHPRTRDPHS